MSEFGSKVQMFVEAVVVGKRVDLYWSLWLFEVRTWVVGMVSMELDVVDEELNEDAWPSLTGCGESLPSTSLL